MELHGLEAWPARLESLRPPRASGPPAVIVVAARGRDYRRCEVTLSRVPASPSRFLQVRTLTAARRELRAADPRRTRVTDVPHDWGSGNSVDSREITGSCSANCPRRLWAVANRVRLRRRDTRGWETISCSSADRASRRSPRVSPDRRSSPGPCRARRPRCAAACRAVSCPSAFLAASRR